MQNRTMIGVGAVIAVIMFPVLAAASPGISIYPDQPYDFGEVEMGTSESVDVTISNAWWGDLRIEAVNLVQCEAGFTLINPPEPDTWVIPGTSLTFGVEFSPETEGLASCTVEVKWTNGEIGVSTVELSGTGIAGSGPLTIEDILAFFDAGVEAGTIEGKGPACSRDAHLKIFKFKLLMVAFFIDKGWDKGACKLLWHAYERSDDQDCPKDWIKGQAVGTLNDMILQLLSDMGCM